MISRRAQIEPGKLFIRTFRFLKADHLGLRRREPGEQTLLSFAERIDIPGDDLHSESE
jgi:hypothetical protein